MISVVDDSRCGRENHKWDKVLKNGPSKICGRQPLKSLLGPFLNTLSQMRFTLQIPENTKN